MKIKFSAKISRTGFSLIESIFSLLIISLAFGLIMFACQEIKRSNELAVRSSFYRYLDVLESEQYDFKLEDTNGYNVNLKSKKDHKEYVLEPYKDMLRLRGVKGGHMPLVIGIDKVRWHMDKHILVTDLKMRGESFEAKSLLR